jgi:hypothetical protein
MLICLLHLAAGLSAAADYGREKDELGTRNYFISSALRVSLRRTLQIKEGRGAMGSGLI